MCKAPKAPEVQDIASRSIPLMPDNGDPTIANRLRNRKRLAVSATALGSMRMGAPSTTAPSTTTAGM